MGLWYFFEDILQTWHLLFTLICSTVGSTVRAVSWLLVFSGHCILAKWLLLSSAYTWDERLLIGISQLSASQFKDMAEKAFHSRNWSLLLVAFCWWGGSALILSLEASRHRSKGFSPGMWDELRHKHKMKMQSQTPYLPKNSQIICSSKKFQEWWGP